MLEEQPTPHEEVATQEPSTPRGSTKTQGKKKHPFLLSLIIILVLLLLAAIVFFGVKLHDKSKPTSLATPQVTASTPSVAPVDKNKPLLQQYPTAPAVANGTVTVANTPTTFTATDRTALLLTSAKVTAAQQPCTVTDPTDFCLAGLAHFKTATFNVYYLKDAIHSRLFEAPASFTTVKVKNSPSAGVLPVNTGTATTPVLVIVNRNSSGWMFVPADSKSKVEGLAAQASLL